MAFYKSAFTILCISNQKCLTMCNLSCIIYLFVDTSCMASEDEKFFESDDDEYFEVYT